VAVLPGAELQEKIMTAIARIGSFFVVFV